MHERGVVHCDIKPANVFVTSERTGRIGDLDVSRDANERITQATSRTAASSLAGTFDYMAPELVSKPADFKSDVYSFGLTVFDMFFMPTLDASSGKLNFTVLLPTATSSPNPPRSKSPDRHGCSLLPRRGPRQPENF